MTEEYVKVEVSSSVLNPGGRSGNMKTFSKALTVEQLKKKVKIPSHF